MQRPRVRALVSVALIAAAVALAVLVLRDHQSPAPLVSQWWPSSVLVTIALLLAPPPARRTLALLSFAGLSAAGLLGGCTPLFSLGFALADTAESLLVAWWLTWRSGRPPQLRSWSGYTRWLFGVGLGALTAGAITAATYWLEAAGAPPWRTLVWVALTHFAAQVVLLPLVLPQPRHRMRVAGSEIALHVVLLALAMSASVVAVPGQSVAFLLLPLLMWGAARFAHPWATVEMIATAAGLVALNRFEHGPFSDVGASAPLLTMAASVQAFVALCAITTVAFSVANCILRDSLERIRHNEMQLGQLLDSASGTAFIATDLDGTITWFSPGAEQMLGFQGADLVGRATPVGFHEPRELSARAAELGVPADTYAVVTAPLERGEDQDTRDWTYVRRDGSRFTVSLGVTAVRDEAGRPISFLSVVRDVTDRRAAEQALVHALDKEREANRRMHEVDRAKGEFVSAVSHELRTPLTSIMGYTELLTEGVTGDLSNSQVELVEKIDRNGGRLLQLVEDLLTLARIEDGSLRLDREPLDLVDVVRAATDEVAHLAHRNRVALDVHLPEQEVAVLGDRHHLERLVLNLTGNAIKFTESGGSVAVTLGIREEFAVLEVCDTGVGIPVEEQAHLFERFFRSSVATDRAIQGTGLGLSIVRSIAEAHLGEVGFESTPGVGTTFCFVIPTSPSQTLVGDAAQTVVAVSAAQVQVASHAEDAVTSRGAGRR